MNIIELAKEAGFVADHVNHDTLLYSGVKQSLERFAALVRAPLQAKIDRLMLEYCPDEMTDEQLAEWGNSQNPVKQEPVACIALALEALIYHTQQTRPIQKTDEAIIYLQNVLNKQEQNMTFTLEDAIKKFPEIAYWHSEFEKHNITAEPVKQEQVGSLEITYGREPEIYATPNAEDLPEGTYRLYAAPVDAKAIRAEALEEAIAILKGIDQTETESDDGWWQTSTGAEFGAAKLAAIRGLK